MRHAQVTGSKAPDPCEHPCVGFVALLLLLLAKALLITAENVLSQHVIVLMPMCLSDSGAVVSAVKREDIKKKKKSIHRK